MISFVNAKINIGLQIVGKRADGYHNLQTVFYPVGLKAGTDSNPSPFCDILELCESEPNSRDSLSTVNQIEEGMPRLEIKGRDVGCPIEKNLIYKAARIFREYTGVDMSNLDLILEKRLPDGAGMGGGSADGAFVLRMLADWFGFEDLPLEEMALRLGADCPFFIRNKASYAAGVGEELQDISLDLSGKWLAVVKPDIYISTKEAFANVTTAPADYDLRNLPQLPIIEWEGIVVNDFEKSIFPGHPEMSRIKRMLYDAGAEYASLTGSGSCLYGIFNASLLENASHLLNELSYLPTISNTYLLEL